MYNLLVVDDERVIADFLYEILSELEELDLIIFKAYSGYEALEYMKKVKIDIVLTDISMPGINGLEVQKQILRQWPQCKTVFLSGYNDFEYVQTALRTEGVDYVLKTEGEQQIIQSIRKALQELEKELKNEQRLKNAENSLLEAMPVLQEKFVLDLINGMEYTKDEIEKHFTQLNISLNDKMPVMLLLARLDSGNEPGGVMERMELLYKIRNIALEYLSNSTVSVGIIYENSRLLWLVQPSSVVDSMYDEELWKKTALYVGGLLGTIQDACAKLFSASVSFAFDKRTIPWDRISMELGMLKLKFSMVWGISNETILIDDEANEEAGHVKTEDVLISEGEQALQVQLNRLEILEEYLENGQKEKFMTLYDGVIEEVKKSGQVSYGMVVEIYFSMAKVFLSYINKWKIRDKVEDVMDLDKLVSFTSHNSWDELAEYLKRLAMCIFEQKGNDTFSSTNKIFGFIRSYAENHLSGDLSLVNFAELLHFHPAHLSRMFKQVTGKNFVDYISDVKVTKARELLKGNDMKINEIAAALGFDSASYFTRFFKKMMGMSPQEYRDSIVTHL